MGLCGQAEEELLAQCRDLEAKTVDVEGRLAATQADLAELEAALAEEDKENGGVAEEGLGEELAAVEAALREKQGILDGLLRGLSGASLNSSRDSNASQSKMALEPAPNGFTFISRYCQQAGLPLDPLGRSGEREEARRLGLIYRAEIDNVPWCCNATHLIVLCYPLNYDTYCHFTAISSFFSNFIYLVYFFPNRQKFRTIIDQSILNTWHWDCTFEVFDMKEHCKALTSQLHSLEEEQGSRDGDAAHRVAPPGARQPEH